MNRWPCKPFIYEINTRVWLTDLCRRYHQHITLGNIPEHILDELAGYQVDAIWPMGVWTRSAAVRTSALNYTHEYRPVLPDLTDDDVIGSGYAIGAYQVDPMVGGRDGLARFREQLQARGMRLILDFVPNHVATDHLWTAQNPGYFVRGTSRDLKHQPGMFFQATDDWGRSAYIAHGRDPYFPGWIDTAQLNAFNPGLRQAMTHTLLDIAAQCDGVRCDMAMLMVNDVFKRTWGWLVEETMPEREFWEEIIPQVRSQHPDFLFMAEVYWNMEYTLQQQGFDYTYDKELYDRMLSDNLGAIHAHLKADENFQRRSVRFIENHDERRAAAAFGTLRSKAYAVLIATLPGAVLLHDGQFTGRKIKLPVQIGRQPDEYVDEELETFYYRLLEETRDPIYQEGQWRLFEVSDGDFIAYGWQHGDEYRLITVNPTSGWVRGKIHLHDWGGNWALYDVLTEAEHPVPEAGGMWLSLQPYEARIFHLPTSPERKRRKKSQKNLQRVAA